MLFLKSFFFEITVEMRKILEIIYCYFSESIQGRLLNKVALKAEIF